MAPADRRSGLGSSRDIVRERKLLRAARRGDVGARRRVVAAHLGLIRSIARRYRGLGLPDDDLVQEGSLGLLDAIDRYDPSRGVDFGAFARFRVRRAIRNALTEQARLVRLPKHVVERQCAIAHAGALLTATSGCAPTAEELAAATGLSVRAVLDARAAGIAPPAELESPLADGSAPDPEQVTIAHEDARLVAAAVASLPAREQEVVTHHYGLGRPAESLAEVAAALHLSQRRTQTLEDDALARLRLALSER